MASRDDYALAALASAVMEHRSELQRPMTLADFKAWLQSSKLRDLVTDEDIARFVDYAVTNNAAELVQTEYALPRVLFNAEQFNGLGAKSEATTPLYMIRRLGLLWGIESLRNIQQGARPSAGTAPTSIVSNAGDSQPYLGFVQNAVGDGQPMGPNDIVLRPVAGPIPASDRYVSVRDNQETFDELVTSLNRIRDQFAKDHNKGEYETVPELRALKSEVFGTLAQIDQGLVRKAQLIDGLKQALVAVVALGGTYPGLVQFVGDAAQVLDKVLKALGIV